jgi:hypothetical protein
MKIIVNMNEQAGAEGRSAAPGPAVAGRGETG